MSDANESLSQEAGHYPLHMILGIVSAAAINDIVADLQHVGIPGDQIDVAEGGADAQQIIEEDKHSWYERIAEALQLSDDQDQRTQYINALQQGDAVISVRLAADAQKSTVAEALVRHGGHFVNYYGRWTVEALQP